MGGDVTAQRTADDSPGRRAGACDGEVDGSEGGDVAGVVGEGNRPRDTVRIAQRGATKTRQHHAIDVLHALRTRTPIQTPTRTHTRTHHRQTCNPPNDRSPTCGEQHRHEQLVVPPGLLRWWLTSRREQQPQRCFARA